MQKQGIKIAVVQKCPSRVDYEKQFGLNINSVYNLSSTKVSRLLKRDVDLIIHKTEEDYQDNPCGFYPNNYDYVILVGSEAVKEFSTKTSVTDFTGKLVEGKGGYQNYIASISPAMLAFKPEHKPVFDQTVKNIHKIISGIEETMREKEYEFYRETSEIIEYLSKVYNNPQYEVVGLDTETSALAPRDGYLLGVSMSHRPDQGVYMDADAFDQTCINLLQKIIDTREIVLHNAKFDMHFLTYHFLIMFHHREGHIHDTLIMHYLLDERQGTHGLKSLAMKYTDLGDYEADLDTFKKEYCSANGVKTSEFTYDYIPWDIIKIYAAKDTDATLQLFNKFYPIICANEKLKKCYETLMLPGLHILTKMEDRGVPVSKLRLEAARELLTNELLEIEKDLWTYPEVKALEAEQGAIFNPNSVVQLRKLLFDHVGLQPTGKLTGTGAISTDVEVLRELGQVHPIPKLILKIRQKSKLRNTYIDKLLPVIDRDQRVRTSFNLTSTTSGRLSSSGRFNMQQLPRDNPLIKGCVVAPEGYKIVALDLTTAEIYYAAVLSEDKAMQQVFINMNTNPDKYPDFHSNIAHMVFGLKCEPSEVKKKFPALRQAAKAISFGILYGSGPAKVAESVNSALLEEGQAATCDINQAKEYINIYFSKFPKLKKWINDCHNQIKHNGFIYNFFGRKRRLLNVHSADRGVAAGEVRSGFNAIIQSVSSDHLLLGASDADKEILDKGLDIEIFALVHDSIVAVVREDLVEDFVEIVTRNIQKDRGCSIPDTPIGLDSDSEKGGSPDYSCGKLQKMFPDLAKVA